MHKSVLLHESIAGLDLAPGKTLVDGTFGGGGHSREALALYPGLRVIGLDRDPSVAKAIEGKPTDVEVRHLNFADINKLEVKPDAILLDLGFSSDQLASVPGLSFMRNGDEHAHHLDMRLSREGGFTAAQVLNSWDESAIELILKGFGEERWSRKIAAEVVRRRAIKPFETTGELVSAIEAVVPGARGYNKLNPATKTFQALRIAVNEELTNLERALENGFTILKPGGRFAIISFHSLEDRMVKNFFRNKAREGEGELITKKPIVPSEEEISLNPRSRSAKLRIIKKI